jgi:predicted O-methyltransferase YrrM
MIDRSLLTTKRFLIITPLFFRNKLGFNKRKIRFMSLRIRDRIDWDMLTQICFTEEYNLNKLSLSKQLYSHLDQIFSSSKITLIVDLGANNGISVRYFADEYPNSKILAFEPYVDNLKLAKFNNKMINVDID